MKSYLNPTAENLIDIGFVNHSADLIAGITPFDLFVWETKTGVLIHRSRAPANKVYSALGFDQKNKKFVVALRNNDLTSCLQIYSAPKIVKHKVIDTLLLPKIKQLAFLPGGKITMMNEFYKPSVKVVKIAHSDATSQKKTYNQENPFYGYAEIDTKTEELIHYRGLNPSLKLFDMKFMISPGKRYLLFIPSIYNEYEGLNNILWLYDRKTNEFRTKKLSNEFDFAFIDYQKDGILKLIKNGTVERININYKELFAR